MPYQKKISKNPLERPLITYFLSSACHHPFQMLLGLLALQSVAPTVFFNTVELGDLDGTNGFSIDGSYAEQGFSSTLSSGDLDGDGNPDLFVTNYFPDAYEATGYIIFGKPNLVTSASIGIDSLIFSGDATVINSTRTGSGYGTTTGVAGDFNDDGYVDLLLGQPSSIVHGAPGTGKGMILYGRSDLKQNETIMLPDLLKGDYGFVVNGIAAGDLCGYSINSAGDTNGDNTTDFLIGALSADPGSGRVNAGEVYLVYGHNSSNPFNATVELSQLNGNNGVVLKGTASGDKAGGSIGRLGDLNKDGYDDFIIGAPRSSKGSYQSGTSYVIYGNETLGDAGSFELSNLNGSNGFAIVGISPEDNSGKLVSYLGDFNNDSWNDILVGAYKADSDGEIDSGEAYVIFGGESIGSGGVINLSELDGTNGFALRGIASGDQTALRAAAVDFNGDGITDLLIGAKGSSPNNKTGAGRAYVVFGDEQVGSSGTFNLTDLEDGVDGLILNGADAGDSVASWVGSVGDINQDGIEDIGINSRYAAVGELSNVGKLYIVYGNSAPVLINNTLSVVQGQTVNLTTVSLSAKDENDKNTNIIFKVASVDGGYFQLAQKGYSNKVTNFTQQDLLDNKIQFVDDGDILPPSYNISVTDRRATTSSQAATVFFSLTLNPTSAPTFSPTSTPTFSPSFYPTQTPYSLPTPLPIPFPTSLPSRSPTKGPSLDPTSLPTFRPSTAPSAFPTVQPTPVPTTIPTSFPTFRPSTGPTRFPTPFPTKQPASDSQLTNTTTSDSSGAATKLPWVLIGAIGGGSALLLLSILGLYCFRWRNKKTSNGGAVIGKTSDHIELLPVLEGGQLTVLESRNKDLFLPIEKITLGPLIASGAFGQVYQGTYVGEKVAVKRLKLHGRAANEELLREAEKMKSFKSEFIVQLRGLIKEKDGRYGLVMECMESSLYELLHNFEVQLTWEERLDLASNIASGLRFLHGLDFLHRDLKSLNVLVRRKNAKLADFGFAKLKEGDSLLTQTPRQHQVGTARWLAPELISSPNASHTPASDVFSLGLVFLELVLRAVPFEETNDMQLVMLWISNGTYQTLWERIPQDCPEMLREAIKACGRQTPGERPKAADLANAFEALLEEEGSLASKTLTREKTFTASSKTQSLGQEGSTGSAGLTSNEPWMRFSTQAPSSSAEESTSTRFSSNEPWRLFSSTTSESHATSTTQKAAAPGAQI